MKILLYSLFCIIILLQSGCTALVVGGGTAAAIAVDKRTTGMIIEDENIEMKFTYRYYQDKQLSDHSHVNITSYNGWVLLTGQVSTEQHKQNVYDLAITIANVKQIFNEVKIADSTTLASRANDAYLTSKIKTLLLADQEVSSFHVKVVTEDSEVFLMGMITPELAKKTVEIVRNVRGVKKVIKLFNYQ